MPFELEKSPHAQSDPSFRYTILRNMGDDSLYYPHQGLYLMGQPEEGLRSNRLGSSVIRGVSPGSVILRHGALLLAPNVGVTPQRRMMNHPDEVSRVRKLASVV
ncbi:hypothetical protein GW17_00026057 [Ensete ventricosum]|nr:hypothetical protein GW17_00026057 [Ensete ventricosum]